MRDNSELTKPFIRLVLSLVILGIVNFIVTKLPMWQHINLKYLGLPFNITSLVTAVIASIMIFLVLKFGNDIGPTLERFYPQIPDIKKIAEYASYLLVICIAYTSYSGIIVPYLGIDNLWLYDIVFFFIALIPICIIGMTLWNKIDFLTGNVHSKVQEAVGAFIDCQKCGARNDDVSKFCKNCGAVLEIELKPAFCMECGNGLDPDAKFCPTCGKENRSN